jgi:hypothetical protein
MVLIGSGASLITVLAGIWIVVSRQTAHPRRGNEEREYAAAAQATFDWLGSSSHPAKVPGTRTWESLAFPVYAERLSKGLPVGGEPGSMRLGLALILWRDRLSSAARDAYAERCLREAEAIGSLGWEARGPLGVRGAVDIYVTAFNVASDPGLKSRAAAAFGAEARDTQESALADYSRALVQDQAGQEANERQAMERRLTSPYPPTSPPPYDRPPRGRPPQPPSLRKMPVWDGIYRGN